MGHRDGYGFARPLEGGEDLFLSAREMYQVFDGDEILVAVAGLDRRGRAEGQIAEVLERAHHMVVGRYMEESGIGFLLPHNTRIRNHILIPPKAKGGARHGQLVSVSLTDYPSATLGAKGRVEEVLGDHLDPGLEIDVAIRAHGIPWEWPDEVLREAGSLGEEPAEQDKLYREDLRALPFVTIDGEDARDFDDAVWCEANQHGFRLLVAIADVSHYVQEGTILDDEAYERATSVYLVDRVVPMLPEVLSNNACSLRPLEEKYTFSAVFKINNKAEVKEQWFGRTVTYSDARFAYEEAQAIIESKTNNIPQEVSLTGELYQTSPEITQAVLKLNELAKIMRKRRMNEGAISFDKVEVKFDLDAEANPVGVFFKTTKDANKLIEEFMLLANKKVAEFVGKQSPKKTFIYRVHDEPDVSKLATLQGVVSKFGYKLNFKDKKTTTASLNNLLQEVVGKKEQNLVDTLTIRTMSKAEYTTHNVGHYGLAFNYYSHFTSPIRRYPDVMAHRLLQLYLDGGKSVNEDIYEDKCNHSSNMENLATKAERDSIKYMQIRFMEDHKNEEFLGVISGVTDWGIYVEIISNKCEGMVSVRDIKDDHYVFDEGQYALVGKVTKNMYQLGDEVVVKVKNTDLVKKHLDFNLIGKKEE